MRKGILIVLASLLIAQPVNAATSAQHTSKASKHSALALKEGSKTTVKTVATAVAVPMIISGQLSEAAGKSVKHVGTKLLPLKVTKTTVTADAPPNQAIKKNNKGDCNEQ